VAIQAAITAASVNGGNVYFPSGIYIISIGVAYTPALDILGDNVKLLGSSGAILKLAATSAVGTQMVRNIGNDDITIKGLEFDHNGIVDAAGIVLGTSLRVKILENLFTNPVLGGLYIGGNVEEVEFSNNIVSGGAYGVCTTPASNISHLLVTDNIFRGIGGDAIEINTPGGGATDVVIQGNIISGYPSIGIGAANVIRFIISKNSIVDCGEGIHLEDRNVGGVVCENNIYNCAGAGITLLSLVATHINDIVVAGNNVSTCCISTGEGSIGVVGVGGKDGIVIINNIVEGSGIDGIAVLYDAKNIIVGNNLVRNSTGSGIRLDRLTDSIISGNRCYDDSGGTQTYGIEMAGAMLRVNVVDNMLSGNVTAAILETALAGTYTYRGNEGWTTRNYGAAAAVVDGGTIAHGLVATPLRANVSPSIAGEMVTVTSLDATHITVAIKKHDGTAGTAQTIYWEAEI
jgi:hypothetical protein